MPLPDLSDDQTLDAALGCEPETVQARALAGELPGLKFGRGWVFPREALLDSLNRQAREQAEARRAATKPTPEAVAVTSAACRKQRRALPKLPNR